MKGIFFFFFQAEDGIRDIGVTGVQTCALPIFFAWLKKVTVSRGERMSAEDIYASAAWGAVEAARAGVTSLGDASDAGASVMRALRDVGLRGTVFSEAFGPDSGLRSEEHTSELQSRQYLVC